MSKIAVVYWSGTGNTEAMAKAVLKGAEELEDGEFLPMYESIKGKLSGKKVVLFGSYGWGDGEWMRNWDEEVRSLGAAVAADFVIANEVPDDAAITACEGLGAGLLGGYV